MSLKQWKSWQSERITDRKEGAFTRSLLDKNLRIYLVKPPGAKKHFFAKVIEGAPKTRDIRSFILGPCLGMPRGHGVYRYRTKLLDRQKIVILMDEALPGRALENNRNLYLKSDVLNRMKIHPTYFAWAKSIILATASNNFDLRDFQFLVAKPELWTSNYTENFQLIDTWIFKHLESDKHTEDEAQPALERLLYSLDIDSKISKMTNKTFPLSWLRQLYQSFPKSAKKICNAVKSIADT